MQYTWRNRLLLDLPMRAGDHDPVGGLTVNRGRAGAALDGDSGVGAANDPVKLGYRRGYSFDGSSSFRCSDSYGISSGLVSVLATFTGDPAPAPLDTVYSWEFNEAITVALLVRFPGSFWFFTGGVTNNNAAQASYINYGGDPGKVTTVCGVHDGTNTIIYVNGQFAANAVTPLPPISDPKPMHVGERGFTNFFFEGDIHHVGMGDFAMTPGQVSQYHREMMKRFSQV